jgi:hypothetical protein
MLPASMMVDWVRVYQLKDDDRHFVGCNHPRYPTQKFIQAHKWRYMRDTENEPLQKVSGECVSVCVCDFNWRGDG